LRSSDVASNSRTLLCSGSARYLAENDVSAKKAIATIRRARLGESESRESPVRLHQALIRTVNDHLVRYPETMTKDILVALYMTEKAVEEMPPD
jgi:hypothetical protein